MLKEPHPKSTQWDEAIATPATPDPKLERIEVTIRGLTPVPGIKDRFALEGVSTEYVDPDTIRQTFKLDDNSAQDEMFVGFLLDQYCKHQITKILADRIVA